MKCQLCNGGTETQRDIYGRCKCPTVHYFHRDCYNGHINNISAGSRSVKPDIIQCTICKTCVTDIQVIPKQERNLTKKLPNNSINKNQIQAKHPTDCCCTVFFCWYYTYSSDSQENIQMCENNAEPNDFKLGFLDSASSSVEIVRQGEVYVDIPLENKENKDDDIENWGSSTKYRDDHQKRTPKWISIGTNKRNHHKETQKITKITPT
jgi:hypothetical protein